MEFWYAQGLERSWRPSTPKGVRKRDPLAAFVKVPCWYCIMPWGHVGVVAVIQLARPFLRVRDRTNDWILRGSMLPRNSHRL